MPELLSMEGLRGWRSRHFCSRVVATNGCFDLLHIEHAEFLHRAARYGELLIVGINSDASVSSLKGPSRPFVGQDDRAALLLHLRDVDAVCVFDDDRATDFLDLVRPDVYVKGGGYSLENLDPGERAALDKHGARIEFVPSPGRVSTSLLARKLGA